jgi:putative transposase
MSVATYYVCRMARRARLVIPGCPHHVTQRGNRRQKTFFNTRDYTTYLKLMADSCQEHDLEIWSYCLMPNHVHLIAVPKTADSLAAAIGKAHSQYSRIVNFREDWKGHLWQGRFASFVMDDPYLLNVARYIELNPVRAGLAGRAEKWPYSSASAHIKGQDDRLAKVAPLLALVPDWGKWLQMEPDTAELDNFRLHSQTGIPLGDEQFIDQLESLTGRILTRQKPGPKNN